MSEQRSGHGRAEVGSPADGSPSPTSLTALVAIAMLAALWALFLWVELVLARSGGTPFCPFGERANCVAIWDSGFATAVHRLTGCLIALVQLCSQHKVEKFFS